MVWLHGFLAGQNCVLMGIYGSEISLKCLGRREKQYFLSLSQVICVEK